MKPILKKTLIHCGIVLFFFLVAAVYMSPAFDGKGRALSDYFDACYLSYACRMMKPDPDIFRFVLDNELIRPGELLFVDDGPRNVEVASELGIQAILATDADSWPAEVDRFLQNQER